MKIAVLTMTFNNNYGGMLQAYALMETLKKLGHEPELLFVQLGNRESRVYLKTLLKKYFFSYLSKKWEYFRIRPIIEKNINYFIDTYINPKTKPIYTEKEFDKIVEDKYEAYVIGSDQVWRPTMYRFINHAFFDFVKNPNAVLLSYAPSFGVEDWEYTAEQTKVFKQQIHRLKAVSVREDSGVKLCKEYFEVDAEHVLDPTMLLDIEEYRKIIKAENEPSHSGGLLSYVLDKTDDKKYLQDIVSKELGLEVYNVHVESTDLNAKLEDRIYPTVTSWLKGFDDAEYVVTDSFHGCVFAILFNKTFIVYGNERRGMARFSSLLKMFGLEDRLVFKKEDITMEKIKSAIDWEKVNEKLGISKNKSMFFLRKNLK